MKKLSDYLEKQTKLLLADSIGKMTKNIEFFFKQTKHLREYKAKDVALLRSEYVSNPCWIAMATAFKMRQKLDSMSLKSKERFRALGTLNPTQARAMVEATSFSDADPLDGLYLSGWQEASSGENTYAAMFPDQSIYPVNSVPEKIKKINTVLHAADRIKTQQLQSKKTKKEVKEALKKIDYQSPIIADIEAGFGQEIHTFQLALECIKSGAACLHLEDQDGSLKKCGHMGGKVKVPMHQYITKLKAVRLAADVLGTNTVIIGRTDARGTRLINSVSDDRDDKFCMKELKKSAIFTHPAAIKNELNSTALWNKLLESPYVDLYSLNNQDIPILSSSLRTQLMQAETDSTIYEKLIKQFQNKLSLNEKQARVLFHIISASDYLRTKDGYYRYQAGLDAAIEVAISISPYVDLIWFETSNPDLEEAKQFAKAVHKKYPKQAFHYNCSPSFNWSKHFKKIHKKNWKKELETFNEKLAQYGFKSQKITLFGMHVVNQAIKERVIDYQKRNMAAYSELQDAEKKSGNRSFEHQSFVGVDVWSAITELCAGAGSELLANSGDSATMDQFN